MPEGVQKYRDETLPEKAPVVARWLTSLIQTQDYCSCSTRQFGKDLTPEAVRRSNHAELVKLGELSGAKCLVPKFKSTFPSFCTDLVDELRAQGARPLGPKFCACVQSDLDRVSAENFMQYIQDSMRDHQEFKRTNKVPAGNNSIVASMVRCGVVPGPSAN